MRFLGLPAANAWLVLAGVAALVVLLYLLKPSPRRLVVASGLIWQRVLKERKREPERVRWWLSLLLALAIALALALALTRPEIAAVGGTAEDRVVVIDNSPSMAARGADGRTRLALAIERAQGIVRSAGAGSRFLIADTMHQLPAAAFVSREQALAQLRAVEPRAGVTPWFPDAGGVELPSDTDAGADDAGAGSASPRRVWFVTDGIAGVQVPAGAEVVSVFQSAPNVGITAFEVRALPADPRRHEAFVEVTNAAPGQAQVEVQLAGLGAPPVARTLQLAGNASASLVVDASSFNEGPVRAVVRHDGDALELDNTAYAYLPGKGRVRVALVTAGNADLSRMLRLLPRIEVEVISPARLGELGRFDAAILDRVAPPQAPLVPALLIGPARVAWLAPRTAEVSDTHIARWDAGHPLLAGVALRDVLVDRAATPQPGGASSSIALTALARGPADEPLILAAREGRRIALLSFALADSNFALQPSFPAFLANAVEWLTREPRASAYRLGQVNLPLTGARVLDLDGREVATREVPGATVFDAAKPGLYTAVARDQRVRVAVNLLDPRVTSINRGRFTQATPPAAHDARATWAIDPWMLLLVLAAGLLLLEWWAYHHRVTV
jgi:Ca-activated chloride channel family protein